MNVTFENRCDCCNAREISDKRFGSRTTFYAIRRVFWYIASETPKDERDEWSEKIDDIASLMQGTLVDPGPDFTGSIIRKSFLADRLFSRANTRSYNAVKRWLLCENLMDVQERFLGSLTSKNFLYADFWLKHGADINNSKHFAPWSDRKRINRVLWSIPKPSLKSYLQWAKKYPLKNEDGNDEINHFDKIMFLINHGVNIHRRDKRGKSPLYYAFDLFENGFKILDRSQIKDLCQIMVSLIERGASTEESGLTPEQVEKMESWIAEFYCDF